MYLSLGTIAWNYDWNFAEAEKEFRQALELNPHYSTAHHYLDEFLVLQGRFDEGLAEIERGRELDPASLIINTDIGKCLYMARRYDEAIAQLRRTLEMEPNFMRAYPWLHGAYREKREFDEELAAVQKWVEMGKNVSYLSPLADLYAASGKTAEARKVLEKMEQAAKRTYINPVALAGPYAQLRDNDRALAWLEKEYETRGTGLTALKVDPSWDHLRSDPRYQDLLRRVGFTP